MKKRVLFFLYCVVTVSGCGIFTPREITVTPAVIEPDDPFMFTALLEGTGEKFSRHGWQDFFHGDCRYNNWSHSSYFYDREELISHLLVQHQLHPDVNIFWITKEADISKTAEEILLTNVSYVITSSDNSDTLFAGSSNFRLVRDAASFLKIIKWDDYTDKPFFSSEKVSP